MYYSVYIQCLQDYCCRWARMISSVEISAVVQFNLYVMGKTGLCDSNRTSTGHVLYSNVLHISLYYVLVSLYFIPSLPAYVIVICVIATCVICHYISLSFLFISSLFHCQSLSFCVIVILCHCHSVPLSFRVIVILCHCHSVSFCDIAACVHHVSFAEITVQIYLTLSVRSRNLLN